MHDSKSIDREKIEEKSLLRKKKKNDAKCFSLNQSNSYFSNQETSTEKKCNIRWNFFITSEMNGT